MTPQEMQIVIDGLVRRRLLDVVDDEDVGGGFDGVKLQPELFLDGGEQAGGRVGVGGVRLVVGVAKGDVVFAGEAGLVDQGTVEEELLAEDEVLDRGAGV